MPRPRELEDRVIVPIVLTSRLKREAERLVQAKGLSSLSALIRMLLEDYIQQASGSAPGVENGGNDPPQPDPLTLLEVEDLKDAVSRLEKQVERLEAMAKPLLVGRSGPRVLRGSDLELMDRVQRGVFRLRKEWYELKRWWARLSRESGLPLDEEKGKLINLHGRIKGVEKAL
ncbi:MAG: hypothetical protein QXQ90_06210 [Desulfurococcaceae archaeon]